MEFKIDTNFQTPPVVADYMAKMASLCEKTTPDFPLNPFPKTALEPTPGLGNICSALNRLEPRCFQVHTPMDDFWKSCWHQRSTRFDVVVMNPPFNPVKEMERFVNRAMELSDTVIALLPWVYIINSERRLQSFIDFGFASLTYLPRKTFPNCRVQVGIFELKKGYEGKTEFKRFTW